ncbi:uncharacterized protein LOC126896442 [Daktulosphaira vitifoliae]|uniref:uncharacterized protein LOC126896442 n=1 Tax=Daktulosphaira vitifoliae TaxID=58002 RepID=UPI0021A9AD18|nr:uncharacterized protein LOC126896442 [Daktulosphaira vitifoliae]
MHCYNFLLLICIFICITSSLAGKKKRVKNVKAESSSKSTEINSRDETNMMSPSTKDNISNEEKLIECINKVNLSDETDMRSWSTEEENFTPRLLPTLLKEEQSIPEIRSTLLKNDMTDEQIDLLTSIYNGATSNDTKKLTIDDLKSIFACFSQENTDEEYDIMMKILDSKNDDETGLNKFLSLFILKSSHIQKEEVLTSTRKKKDVDLQCFRYLTNSKSYMDSDDTNRIAKLAKRLHIKTTNIENFKKYVAEKGQISYDEFNDLWHQCE